MVKSYVIRKGHFTDAQRKAYESSAGKFIIPYKNEHINFHEVFGNSGEVTAEIGFGMGLATALIAESNPEKNYIGIEVHKPGVGRLLWEIEKRLLSNIRIIEHDAADVMTQMIMDNSLQAIHLFFPDPWPKKKHHKRRLVQRPFTEVLAQKLCPGGYLYIVTDWGEYGEFALRELSETKGLKNAYKDFAPPQKWRPETKFEKKGLEKSHEIKELFFVKE